MSSVLTRAFKGDLFHAPTRSLPASDQRDLYAEREILIMSDCAVSKAGSLFDFAAFPRSLYRIRVQAYRVVHVG
jgi:hypothetical protein